MLTWPPTAATILLLWPIVTAIISLVYNFFDGIPRVHAVLAVLVKAGVDLPAILDALKRVLSGQTVQTQRAAKVAQDIGKAAVVVLALGLLGATQSACPLPAAVPGDLVTDYACVQQGVAAHQSALQIEEKCLPGQLQTVIDIVSTLLGSPQWRAAHPDMITAAEGVRVEGQAKIAGGAK